MGRRFTATQRHQFKNQLHSGGCRFYLGGLESFPLGEPEELKTILLAAFMSEFGNVVADLELMLDSKGASRDFCYVVFANTTIAQEVLARGSPRGDSWENVELTLCGEHIRLGPAGLGDTPGSLRHLRNTRRNSTHFLLDHLKAMAADLLEDPRVGGTADRAAFTRLSNRIGQAMMEGLPPSFSDEAALASYTLERFSARVGHVFDTLLSLDPSMKALCDTLFSPSRPEIRVASVAGGPGFDVAAMALVGAFLRSPTLIKSKVFEREPLWQNSLGALESSLLKQLYGPNPGQPCSIVIEECDISLPLTHEKNVNLAAAAEDGIELFIFSYVVHENEVLLRTPGDPASAGLQGVFPQLFERCADAAASGRCTLSAFLFLDTTHRLWPALVHTARKYGFAYHLPKMLGGKSAPQEPLLLVAPPCASADKHSFWATVDHKEAKEAKRVSERLACFEKHMLASDCGKIRAKTEAANNTLVPEISGT